MNHFRAICKSMRHREVHKVEQDKVQLDKYAEEDGQTDVVSTNFINSMQNAQVEVYPYTSKVTNWHGLECVEVKDVDSNMARQHVR